MTHAGWRQLWNWLWESRQLWLGLQDLGFLMRRFGTSRALSIIAFFAVAGLPCLASEVAVLKNGLSIRHERHEIVGDVTRLYVSADGSRFVDVPTEQVDHFEAAPELPAESPLSASGTKGI